MQNFAKLTKINHIKVYNKYYPICQGSVPEIEENQVGHSFDELKILEGHSDTVDLIISIDNQRYHFERFVV